MNFGISGGGVGLIGFLILFAAGALALTVVATIIARAVRGRENPRDQPGAEPDRRAPEDDTIL